MTSSVTLILDRMAAGDPLAASELLPEVYAQLRASAQKAMKNERAGHTLSATALVHEVYVKLAGDDAGLTFANRRHFYGAAAEAMRRHLIDHARARLAQKRGGPGAQRAVEPQHRLPIAALQDVADIADAAIVERAEEIVSLDRALSRLEEEDPQAASVVRMRFYAGLSIERTAEVLGLSPATVKRNWQFARAWLFRRMQPPG